MEQSESNMLNCLQEGEVDTTERSGNPGYIVEQPLLAGTLTTVTDVNGVEKYPFNDHGVKTWSSCYKIVNFKKM